MTVEDALVVVERWSAGLRAERLWSTAIISASWKVFDDFSRHNRPDGGLTELAEAIEVLTGIPTAMLDRDGAVDRAHATRIQRASGLLLRCVRHLERTEHLEARLAELDVDAPSAVSGEDPIDVVLGEMLVFLTAIGVVGSEEEDGS